MVVINADWIFLYDLRQRRMLQDITIELEMQKAMHCIKLFSTW